MSFDERDVRVGLDVFSADNVYLGTVVRVRWEGRSWLHREVPSPRTTPHPEPFSLKGKAEHEADPAFSGERLGPMPTAEIGNSGPMVQTHDTRYASQRDAPPWAAPRVPAELLIFRWLVSLSRATVRPVLRRVPAGLILEVSLERVILSARAAELS